MIVIVEGASGSGKSHLTKLLTEATGWPVVRMFRRESDVRIEHLIPMLNYVEDIAATDALIQSGADVICERMLPSALADVYETQLLGQDKDALMHWWSQRINDASCLVYVNAQRDIAAGRSRHGYSADFIERERLQILEWCRRASNGGVPLSVIINDVEDGGAKMLAQALNAIRQARPLGG